MRRDAVPVLACPLCRASYELDEIRGDVVEIVEAFLVCRSCREARAVVGGVAILPRDETAHLRAHGDVLRRSPIADPRMARHLLGRAWQGEDRVPFPEVLARFGDLALAAPPGGPPAAQEDRDLDSLLARLRPSRGRGLDVGTGVGRGAFVLAARLGFALGVDRSLARLRRARNIATTTGPFLVPVATDAGKREEPLDLDRLSRAQTSFAVAEAEALPVRDGAMQVVVWRSEDGEGPVGDVSAATDEALRVLAGDGILVTARAPDAPGLVPVDREGGLGAWRRG